MSEEKVKGVVSGVPLDNSCLLDDKNLTDTSSLMAGLPEKIKHQKPIFKDKPVILILEGCTLFFKKHDGVEYWISEKRRFGSYLVQWIEIDGSQTTKFHRKLSNRYGLDVENKKRDQSLVRFLHNRSGIEEEEIADYLEEVGVFIGENRTKVTISPLDVEDNHLFPVEKDVPPEEMPEEKRNELIKILERPDILSFIDQALYERTPDDGFIIGEVESKHILNFNCIGARLGLSTINTLKGGSSIGKTNTANVVTGLHRTKKVGSLSDTALKYADDLDQIDILYIQETLEEEFKNKETRLMSADDGGFIAETTVKNPKTGVFEVQQTTIPVKTLVTTTTAIELDPEFATRNFIIPVDDSEEQTKRILEENFKSTEKKLQEIRGEIDFNQKYELLKDSYNLLEKYIVLIPFEMELLEIFPTSNPRARRDSKKLMQLIKESALLFQYQRCRSELNGQPILVASWVDLAHAILLGGPILEATLTGFDKRLLEALPIIYDTIEDKGYVTTRSLQKKLRKSSKYAWQILNFFEDNGYIYHDPATKQEYGIKGKAKVYIKTDAREYKSLLLAIGNIGWSDIKKKEEEFIEQQILNSPHQVGGHVYLPDYDPSVPNKVVYHRTSINSEEFRIYKNKGNKSFKKAKKDSEILKSESRTNKTDRPIKQAEDAEIDYKNLNLIEKAILTALASLRKYSISSLLEELKDTFSEDEIKLTLGDMESRGWLA